MLNLKRDYDAYLFGLILADGSLYFNTRNRGKVQIELSYKDKDILESIQEKFYITSYLSSRIRTTQFKTDFQTVIWSCHQLKFREDLIKLGMPRTNKSINAKTPNIEYNMAAFWRGFIDGDGSIGFTGNNQPFISVVIKSSKLAKEYLMFLEDEFNITKILNPNKRDKVYNITIKNEDAISLGDYIYENSTIQLERKYKKYLEFKDWNRTVPKINSRTWTSEEDVFILDNSVEDSMKTLNRTKNSVKTRLWRLKSPGRG